MSGKNSNGLSISFRVDDGIIEHNNRDFIAKNVDKERIQDNVTYCRQDIKEKYSELFSKALEEYNAKQKRKDRRIADYYEHILKSSQCKPYYEIVVHFGDTDSCGLKSGNWEKAKLMLDEFMRGFEKRNPNLKVFNAVMHLDEATPHLHIDFVPITHQKEKGLSLKTSMSGALREQGFISANRFRNEWAAWEEREQKVMTEILRAHDLNRDVKNVHREHLTVDEYKAHVAQVAEIKKVNAHINELKKKNPAELTPDEAETIKNQNDFLRTEIQKRDEKIAALSQKLGAKFVSFEIYSEEKLQFVADELMKLEVPFVEENTALHIPEYAQKTALAISENYRPVKSEGVREKIRLDVDRLVYSCANFEDLLRKLQERGYEIKHGKYIAVKNPSAERFVRLNTLGEAYVPKNLEKRISEREKFPNAVREKLNAANVLEKNFHITILNMTVEISRFRLPPKKDDPKKFYAFQNDANINFLAEQLKTISEFGFSSREDVYAKADELKNGIEDKTAKLKALSDELPTLKSEISQLRFLFSALSSPEKPDALTQSKIAIAQKIADKHGVHSKDDIANLDRRLKFLPDYIASIKKKSSDDQLKLRRISNVISAYEKIADGNYIDDLIKAQKEKEQEHEREHNKWKKI